MSNFIEHLKNLNAKERFYLVGYALGKPGFELAQDFREQLGKTLKLSIPFNAFSAMDFHLDWLYASLSLEFTAETKPHTDGIYCSDGKIKGHQQDIDWLIVFNAEGLWHIILIEAKGKTNWDREQLKSKINRLEEIFGKEGTAWPGVIPHFVFMSESPREHIKKLLKTIYPNDHYPKWMLPNGEINWLALPMPTNLKRVVRCDRDGKQSKKGDCWKTVKR